MDVRRYLARHGAQLPTRPHIFVTDPHADADALLDSLQLAGVLTRTTEPDGFELSPRTDDSVLVLGGDYLDKGPSDLRMLRLLRRLVDARPDIILLAGNHDIRTLLGARYAEADSPQHAHLFVRMGKKVVPLLREVWDAHLADRNARVLGDDEAARRLLPPPSWYTEFPPLAERFAPAVGVAHEVNKVGQKAADFADHLASAGMTLGMAHAAVCHCRAMFAPGGEHGWLFERMVVAHCAGALLFVHAGIDDRAATMIANDGTDAVNARYHQLLADDVFELYFGPLGNLMRTKYRDRDLPFSQAGADSLRGAGIHAIAHGHRTHTDGHHHLELRHGLLHFECDTCLDRNTRRAHGLTGSGASATQFGPGDRLSLLTG